MIVTPSEKLTVIRDTREKNGWDFIGSQYVELILSQCMPTGDYTLKGMEEGLCIERKQSISEFAGNVSEDRFIKVLERMKEYTHRYLIFEFDLQAVLDWPQNAGIPEWKIKQIRISPQFLMRFLSDIQVNYGIHTLYCGNRKNAQYTAINIMRRLKERESLLETQRRD